MCSTPAPPLTAWVAANTWSGVGEVNTAPGAAASSMPAPTNPPCSGSCPLPPPETSATLPCIGASARTMYAGSRVTLIRSGCARAMPCSASVTTVDGSLMIFFTRVLSFRCRRGVPAPIFPPRRRCCHRAVPATPLDESGSAVTRRRLPQPHGQAGHASLELLELGDLHHDRGEAQVGDQLGRPRRRRRHQQPTVTQVDHVRAALLRHRPEVRPETR